MPEQGYTLTAKSIAALRRDHQKLANLVEKLRKRKPRHHRCRCRVLLCKADATIAALSGSVPGSGTVSIWDKINGVWTDTGRNGTAYNFSAATVSTGKFLITVRHKQSGDDLFVFESCS